MIVKAYFLSRAVIHFQKYPFIDILPEPLNKWTNLEGNDMLGLIYSDPERWGLAQVLNRFTYFEYFSCISRKSYAYSLLDLIMYSSVVSFRNRIVL